MQKKLKKKRCKACKKEFQPNVPLQQVCDYKCAIELVKKNKEVKELKEWKVRKKVLKEGLKKLSEWKEDLQKEINAIVRLIDKGHECISSGNKKYIVNAGHLYSVGSFPALRFNLLNIFNQSVDDNLYRSGNGVVFKERIVEVFGQDISDEIEGLKIKYPVLHILVEEIKEKLPIVRKIVKELKKETEDFEQPFSLEQRITLRRELNKRIGIYN